MNSPDSTPRVRLLGPTLFRRRSSGGISEPSPAPFPLQVPLVSTTETGSSRSARGAVNRPDPCARERGERDPGASRHGPETGLGEPRLLRSTENRLGQSVSARHPISELRGTCASFSRRDRETVRVTEPGLGPPNQTFAVQVL